MPSDQDLNQIKRYRARRRKAFIAHYSSLCSLILFFSTFSQGLTPSSLFAGLTLLPLPLYFLLQSYKLARKTLNRPLIIDHQPSSFSLWQFLTQPSWALRITLILLFLTSLTALARLNEQTPTLSMNPQSSILDH